MFISTLNDYKGKDYEVIGIVAGNIVQSKNVAKDIGAGLKSMIGGELNSYTQMLKEAREIAVKRMVDEANSLGGDAVINLRYSSSAIVAGAAEIIAYGTAIKFV